MSQYVVDASIVIQHFITDTYTTKADALFDELGNSIELFVPEFCLLECTNVIWKEVRLRGMPQIRAENLIDDLESATLSIIPSSGLLNRALQIGLAHQLAIYDSVYIALAEKLGYPLITVDRKQATAATAVGITLKSVTDFAP